jgi:Fic family protein
VSRGSLYRHRGPLITDPAALADVEAKNALLQFDEVRRLIAERSGNMSLTPTDVCELNRLAIQGIYDTAGRFRDGPIGIGNTIHVPPPAEEVPGHVKDMCDYANSVADKPLHVASYLMWRLNWIHPFCEGNGRTSRAAPHAPYLTWRCAADSAWICPV